MEYFVLEKIAKTKEIKNTYAPQIDELENQEGDMFGFIIDDLKKCMDEEV